MDTYYPLPLLLTSFVGRVAEKDELAALVRGARLVTVTGAGGAGKTRLAIETARALGVEFDMPPVFCDLGAIAEGPLVLHAFGNALEIHEASAQTMLEAVLRRLNGRRVLLLVDNAEHVAADARAIVEALLRGSPDVRILATSRIPLGVSGERIWRLPPMALPALDSPASDSWRAPDAVELFASRVEAADAGYTWDEARRAAAARICRRLDGIPLALEIAAARVGSLAIEDLERQLECDLSLLDSTAPAELRRHDTLHATLDWSYRMLAESEQVLLRRLSVFSGGATIEQAEVICGCDESVCGPEARPLPGVVRSLALLVEHSLVVVRQANGEPARYALLEPLRDFAVERLAETAERAAVVTCHRQYFLELAEAAAAELRGTGQADAMRLLDAENGNIRAALASALKDGGDIEAAARLAVAMELYWRIRARFHEALQWFEQILGRLHGAPMLRGSVLRAAGCTESLLGHGERAIALLRESVAVARAAGTPAEVGEALCWLGEAYERKHDAGGALACAEEAAALIPPGDAWLEAFRLRVLAHGEKVRTGDMTCVEAIHQRELERCQEAGDYLFTANVLNCIGEFARWRGEYARAEAIYKQSMAKREAIGDRGGRSLSLLNLGLLSVQTGQAGLALEYLAEALDLTVQIGSVLHAHCVSLGLAGVAALLGDGESAARLLGISSGLNQDPYFDPPDAQVYDAAEATARRSIGDQRFDLCFSAGTFVARDSAAAEMRSSIERARRAIRNGGAACRRGEDANAGLSRRETEILGMLAAGMSNREIADRLVLSTRTVETHVANAYGKLNVTNRAEATARAIALGLPRPARIT